MYEQNVIRLSEHPMNLDDATLCIEWMRENIYPTLDHLTEVEFKDAVALYTAEALGLIAA